MHPTLEQLGSLGVIPVVALENAADAQPLGEALLAGGLPCAEITFRTAAAAETIRTLTDAFPDLLTGAGTVLSVEQARQAAAAGARFIVSPGFDPAVVGWCLARDLPVIPGVMTPTEISRALAKGLDILKFFPAEAAGGVRTLQAIAGPYGGVRFIPTGGINPENLASYLRLPSVHACGGSWMVKKQLLAAGDFAAVTRLARDAVARVHQARGG